MSAEVDALLKIAALVLVVIGGYTGIYAYQARPVLKAAGTLVRGLQTIRAAKVDGVLTDTELIQIGRDTVQFDAECGDCLILARPLISRLLRR